MNPIIEYWKLIESGKETTSSKIRRTYKHVVEDIINNDKSEWEYSEAKAWHAIDFIERYCKHSKGSVAGQPCILEVWQKALIATMFGIVGKVDGLRKYQEVVLIVARKNGRDLPPNIVMC